MKQPSTHWLDNTHAGDCLGLLQRMRDDGVQVQTCITSPPYFRLRSYLPPNHPDKSLEIGACKTPEQYITRLVQVFRAVREILADDGTLWIVIGDSYAGSLSARPASAYIGGKHGAAQVLLGIPWLLAFALRRDGWYLRQDIIWHKPNAMPESVKDRCTRAHEYLFLLSKRAHYYFDQTAICEPAAYPRGPGNLHPARQPPHERLRLRNNLHNIGARATRNKRDVWTVATGGFKSNHFAVFPRKLIEPCVLAASRVGDTVLDPFMGSGTTAAVALQHQRHFIGCELVEAFIEQQRLHCTP